MMPQRAEDLTLIVNGLTDEIRELRDAQTQTPVVRSMIFGTTSPFIIVIPTEDVIGDFQVPTNLIYNIMFDPLYHIIQYQLAMKK